MARKGAKPFLADLDVGDHRKLAFILERTGETRTAMLKRLVEGEYEKITMPDKGIGLRRDKQVEVAGTTTANLDTLMAVLEEIKTVAQDARENSKATRTGANKILAALFVVIKEDYRILHLLTKIFAKFTLLLNIPSINLDKNTTIMDNEKEGKECDSRAVDSFRAAINLLANADIEDVLKALQKK